MGIGEQRIAYNHQAPWQRAALCDICRRYVGRGGHGSEPIEGTMFCASACPGQRGESCAWPASDELIAEWRAWAAERAVAWERAAAEGERIAERRHALRRLGFEELAVSHAQGRVRGIVLG